MIFASLPVADLAASIAFYKAIGFEQNPQFSDDTAACMVWSEAIHAMLLTHDKWRSFTQRPFPPAGSAGLMLSLSMDRREDVDAMNIAAAAHGGRRPYSPGVTLHDAVHRGEADTGALVLGSGVQALEGAEQLLGVRHVEAGAVVPDEEDALGALAVGADLDARRGLLAGELPGVAQQVLERRGEQASIAAGE